MLHVTKDFKKSSAYVVRSVQNLDSSKIIQIADK